MTIFHHQYFLLLITVNMTPRFPKYIGKKETQGDHSLLSFQISHFLPGRMCPYIQMFYKHQLYFLGIMVIRSRSFLCFSDLHLVNVQNQLSNLLYNSCCFTIIVVLEVNIMIHIYPQSTIFI